MICYQGAESSVGEPHSDQSRINRSMLSSDIEVDQLITVIAIVAESEVYFRNHEEHVKCNLLEPIYRHQKNCWVSSGCIFFRSIGRSLFTASPERDNALTYLSTDRTKVRFCLLTVEARAWSIVHPTLLQVHT